MHHYHSGYLRIATHQKGLREIVKRCVEQLKPHAKEYDSIVCTGVSGMLVGPIVAYRLHKPLVVVRKEGTPSHTSKLVEGQLGNRYVFLDDFVSIGTTLRRVHKTLTDHDAEVKCVGLMLYRDETGNCSTIKEIVGDVFVEYFYINPEKY
jgi:adenine/guanine phosphoribosyltransferase-like PRPP-binding protein